MKTVNRLVTSRINEFTKIRLKGRTNRTDRRTICASYWSLVSVCAPLVRTCAASVASIWTRTARIVYRRTADKTGHAYGTVLYTDGRRTGLDTPFSRPRPSVWSGHHLAAAAEASRPENGHASARTAASSAHLFTLFILTFVWQH